MTPRTHRKSRLTLALLMLSAAIGADATIVLDVDEGGHLNGARGIEIDGAWYDVEFTDGSCIDVFGGCEQANFLFQTYNDAQAAARALVTQIFMSESFETSPHMMAGCTDTVVCQVVTPYAMHSLLEGYLFGRTARNYAGAPQGYTTWSYVADGAFDLALWTDTTWARWSVGAAPIPAPGVPGLLAAGLVAFAFARSWATPSTSRIPKIAAAGARCARADFDG